MTLIICGPDSSRRVRRKCPYHKHLCFGEEFTYYDDVRVHFDCGTYVSYGYGEWRLPPKKKCPKCRKWFRSLDMRQHLRQSGESGKVLLSKVLLPIEKD